LRLCSAPWHCDCKILDLQFRLLKGHLGNILSGQEHLSVAPGRVLACSHEAASPRRLAFWPAIRAFSTSVWAAWASRRAWADRSWLSRSFGVQTHEDRGREWRIGIRIALGDPVTHIVRQGFHPTGGLGADFSTRLLASVSPGALTKLDQLASTWPLPPGRRWACSPPRSASLTRKAADTPAAATRRQLRRSG